MEKLKRTTNGDYESIAFDVDKYDGNKDFLWDNIGKFLKILSDCGYVAVVHPQEVGIVCVDYQSIDPELGCAYPIWISAEDAEYLEYDSNDE